jgi:hypothetical protein
MFYHDNHHLQAPMMGGMWAFRVENDRHFSEQFRSLLFNRALIMDYALNRDQQFLNDHLWPYAKYRAMVHASYWCTQPDWNIHHRPFPTQRLRSNQSNYSYIGCPRSECTDWIFDRHPCPKQCRPQDHEDWLTC